MSKKNRTERTEATESADFGAWALIIMVVVMVFLAYNYKCIGDKWTKVLEIVGAPFSLGLGFFAFEKGLARLDEYKKNNKKEGDN